MPTAVACIRDATAQRGFARVDELGDAVARDMCKVVAGMVGPFVTAASAAVCSTPTLIEYLADRSGLRRRRRGAS
jgi:hypothetical protein